MSVNSRSETSLSTDSDEITNNSTENTALKSILKEYQQKQSSFNPNKRSPNMFLNKLELRMKSYYNELYQSKSPKHEN